jgi:hypothetical protein
VTAIDEESGGFDYYSRQKSPKIREDKKKDGIFVGPQITKQCEDQDINTQLNCTEIRD